MDWFSNRHPYTQGMIILIIFFTIVFTLIIPAANILLPTYVNTRESRFLEWQEELSVCLEQGYPQNFCEDDIK